MHCERVIGIIHRVAFKEVSGHRVLFKSVPENWGLSACGTTHETTSRISLGDRPHPEVRRAPHKTHLLPWVFPSLSSSQPLCPEQDPQTKDHGHLQVILCDGGHAVHARVLSNIPGLHPLDTSGNPPTCSTSKPAPRPGQALSSQDLELNQILPFPRGVHGLLGQVAMEHSMTAQRYASNWNVLTTCYVPVTILNLD